MSFSFCKIIISNDGVEEGGEGGDDRIDEKGVGFERSCDFEMIFIEACSSEACSSKAYNSETCSSFSSLNESSRSSKSSKKVNGFDS